MLAPPISEIVGYALRLRGVRVHSCMGVSDAERAQPQELVVAVDLELSGARYPGADEIERAADYAEIVRVADETAKEQAFKLLETFALRVARRLVRQWPSAERVRVAVTKAVEEEPPGDPLREAMAQVNPDELTPREALELLYRLKKL